MILKQYYLSCLSHASYLIADESSRIAVIVDPQRDVDQYVVEAEQQDLQIRHVFLTHFHADFVSGHLELRKRTGAEIHLGAKARADYPFTPMSEGGTLDLGGVRFGILETPGHTPEGISILVYDLEKSTEKPQAVLTGDTLFIGDVGRPDLMASVGVTAKELAGEMYDTLHGKLLRLPDEVLVYPAHGAGSMCGKNLSTDTVSTIGDQRRLNYALQPMSRDEFVTMVTSDQPDAPAYFALDSTMNRQERSTLDESMERSLGRLPLDQVLRRVNAGAQLLDVRGPAEFAAGHMVDAVNIPLSGRFASWAGTLLDGKTPIIVIAPAGREEEVAMRLGRVGYDHVAGFLEGGMAAVEAEPDLIRSLDRITPHGLSQELASAKPPLVLDVRGPGEWESKRIEGSINLPLNRLSDRLDDVPRDRKFVVHCESGYRSSIAASLLQKAGVAGFFDLAGGLEAWETAKLRTIS
ncbi:MAG: MBL fold metallo-hydrolase [Planctomycetota bacterium]|nr:MBL fold metallo-hydrolase [Planctomycetota bacterium]